MVCGTALILGVIGCATAVSLRAPETFALVLRSLGDAEGFGGFVAFILTFGTLTPLAVKAVKFMWTEMDKVENSP